MRTAAERIRRRRGYRSSIVGPAASATHAQRPVCHTAQQRPKCRVPCPFYGFFSIRRGGWAVRAYHGTRIAGRAGAMPCGRGVDDRTIPAIRRSYTHTNMFARHPSYGRSSRDMPSAFERNGDSPPTSQEQSFSRCAQEQHGSPRPDLAGGRDLATRTCSSSRTDDLLEWWRSGGREENVVRQRRINERPSIPASPVPHQSGPRRPRARTRGRRRSSRAGDFGLVGTQPYRRFEPSS